MSSTTISSSVPYGTEVGVIVTDGTITLADPTGHAAGADTLNLVEESGVSVINIDHAATWTLDMPVGTSALEVLEGGAEDMILLPSFTATSEIVLPGVGLILGGAGDAIFLNLPQQNSTAVFDAEITAAGTETQIATSVVGIGNIPAPVADTSGVINGGNYTINSTLFGSAGGTAQSGGVGVTIGNAADVVVSGTVYGGAGGNGTDGYWDVIPGQYPAPNVTIWRAGEPGGDGGVGVYLSQSVLVNFGNIVGGVPGENGLTAGYPGEVPAGGIGVVIASGTLINAGTISGTDGADAVSFSNAGEIGSGFTYGTGTLVVEPTAVFNGDVVADSRDVLVLVDPTATELSEVGTLFQGFGTVDVVGSAPCFCVGTRIRTPRGTVLVEGLRVGDEVMTAFFGARPIKWIGRRSYEGRFIAGNRLVLPVCIKADAIADGIPSRDLFVSPDHAICEDGVLVHAWRLVNDVSIVQATEVALVEYLHIELDGHHIVFAEDCPTESFYDADCRERFQSGEGQPGVRPERMCLPLLKGGFQLEMLRRRLAERAGLATPVLALGPLRGCLDEAGPKRLCGWAQDVAAPESPVTLEVMADGAPVGLVLANEFRADLREAELGSGCHAFSMELPSGVRDVEIRRAADGAMLVRTKLISEA